MIAQILDATNYSLNNFSVISFITASAVFFLGSYSLIHERFSFVSKLLFFMSLSGTWWLFSFSLMYSSREPTVALWWGKAAYLTLPTLPSLIYHFTLVILRIYQKHRLFLVVSWLLSFFFVAMALSTDYIIDGLYRYWWGFYPKYGIFSIPYLFFFFGVSFRSFSHYWIEYRRAMPNSMHQRRIRLFLIAFCITSLSFMDYAAKFGIPLYPCGNLPILVFLIMASRAISRYSLVDITPAFAADKITDTMTDGLFVLDQEGVVRLVNKAAVELFGPRCKEPVGKHISSIISDEIFAGDIVQLKSGKGVSNHEITYDRDGERYYLNVSSSVMKDRRGRPVAVVCIARDVTKRKHAEERLVQSLDALQSVYRIATTIGGSYEAICDEVVLSLASILKVSYVAVQHIEEDRLQIVSALMEGNLHHNDAAPLEHSPCNAVREKGAACQIKGPLRRLFPKHEFIFSHDFRTHAGVPIRGAAGKVEGLICVMDTGERVFTEDEIKLIEIFARYVSYEIERQAMESELRQLDKIKLVGQMAAGVAHEVRNPLNAILAITEALFQDIGNNPEYTPFLTHIRTQVDRLAQLMGDLLDLGKPIQPSNLEREHLPAVCASSIDLWKQSPLFRNRNVRLILPPEPANVDVMADSPRLQQVFLNLLENAGQHSTEESEIRVSISSNRKTTVRVCIIDEGSGLAEENLHKVFEPFFTTRKGGNGLGLSIVKNTVEGLGGTVTIRNNQPPPGCIVEIVLPLAGNGAP